jgi:hemolysin activation/secretion protein
MEFFLRRAILLSLLLAWSQGGWSQAVDQPLRFTVTAFTVSGDNPLGDRALGVLQPYVGEQVGLQGLAAAADALEQALIEAGYSFHRVSLPPQSLDQGQVELKVVSFVLGKTRIEGNRHFDRDNILRALPQLVPGEAPNTLRLGRALDMANEHPARQITLTFRESEQADAIDAVLAVKDSNPQLFFVNLDNSGSADGEAFRATLGYQHSNLFNRDHALTATLTFAPEDPSSTRQIGINYHLPLYAHGAFLDFLVSDSEVSGGTVAENVEVSGKGGVFGASYRRPLLAQGGLRHSWRAGLQYKLYNNSVDVNGTVLDSDVLSLPLELGYQLSYSTRSHGVLGLDLALLKNIESGSHNNPEDYQRARNGAEPDWSLWRYRLNWDLPFAGDWLLRSWLKGQGGSDRLIPGEQFGVGGAASLRGFEERSITADTGTAATLEIWSPAWKGLRGLLFYDLARLRNNALPGLDEPEQDLSSWGLGLRYGWKQQLSIALDHGVIIEGGSSDPGINQDGDSKTHFNLIYRF